MVHLDVNGLWISRSVAERLHHHVGAETQASQVFQLVARHGACGVLGAHSGHLGFAIGAWTNALTFWQTACTAHHFLRYGKASFGRSWNLRQTEQGRGRQAQKLARLDCQ